LTRFGRAGRFALPFLIVLAALLRILWPLSDPPLRLSWSNGIYTDPATMAHAARNAVLFHEWVLDYNRDLWIYPLVNLLTYLAYLPFGPGRLPAVVLGAFAGTATVVALVWGLARVAGSRAAVLGGILAAVSHWLIMYARNAVSENVVATLLAFACVAATSRSARSLFVAGALGVGATLFGKYHAVGFLPGLVLFVLLRERSLKRSLPLLAGGAAVFAAWVAFIFAPHASDILRHVERQSTGHGALPITTSLQDGVGEIFNTLRRSWLFYRMPVCGALGSLFAIWTVFNPRVLRGRLQDGSAIYALWFLSHWLYFSALSYKAPRYYLLVAPPLVAGTAVLLAKLFEGNSLRLRAPSGACEHIALVVWLYAFAFGTIDTVKHYASMALDYLTLPPPRISDRTFDLVVSIFQNVDTFQQNIVWAGVVSALSYVLILWSPEITSRFTRSSPSLISGRSSRRMAATFTGIAIFAAAWQYLWWATHRTTYIEDVKSSLAAMIGKDAVVLGPLAPLLTQDSTLKCLPYFGPPFEEDLLRKYGVTHVVLCGKKEAELLDERYPGLFEKTQTVHVWPVKTLFASTIELRRVPQDFQGARVHSYEPTLYELAAEKAEAGEFREALERFEEFRARGGREIPELLSLESVCWFKLETYDRAESLLVEAIGLRPRDPLNYQNLGVLKMRLGMRSAALENFLKAFRLDPKNEELEAMLRELAR
jgi:4-amino-4-deoxy-L-arabinose transferase-like glycosyltransferase